jgi:2-polyprenyl-3-methyl-5-hydroxy-6-metoxy-1,4-benzoquinol methylase
MIDRSRAKEEPMPSLTNDVDVEAFNDRLAREHPIDDYYDRSPLPIRLIERRRLAIIREMIGEAAGLDLAEIGSGGGHVLRMFPKARITAIDVSDVFLDTARKNLAGYDARFVKGEVDKLDLPAESFDRVICTEVLEHTVDPEAILRTIARLLRPKGVAVITVPNDPLINRLKGIVRRTPVGYLLRGRIQWGGDEFHLHQWTPREFENLLAKHFRVTARKSAPHDALPIRACFRCISR